MKRVAFSIITLGVLFLGACASIPTGPNRTPPNPQMTSSGPVKKEVAPPKQEVVIACVRPAFDGKTVSVVAKDHSETETGKRRSSMIPSRVKAEEILVVRGAVTQQLRAWGATVTESRADAQIIFEIMIRRSGRHHYVHFFLMDKVRRVELAQGIGSAISAHSTLRDDALRYAAQVAISKLCVYQERRSQEGAARVQENAPQASVRVAPSPSPRSYASRPSYPYGYHNGGGVQMDTSASVEVYSPARSRGTVRGFEYGPDGNVKWKIEKIRR